MTRFPGSGSAAGESRNPQRAPSSRGDPVTPGTPKACGALGAPGSHGNPGAAGTPGPPEPPESPGHPEPTQPRETPGPPEPPGTSGTPGTSETPGTPGTSGIPGTFGTSGSPGSPGAAAMAEGGPRRLRPWLLAQLRSGRFPGLQWDDAAQTALRIPWAHGGRSGARESAGAALCRAWAEYKGRVQPGDPPDPAGWKTRLRCALARSPEFRALPGRGRSDGPSPYRVYRLLPAREPKPPKARKSQKEAGLSPAEPLPPTPPPENQEEAPDEEDPEEAPPPEELPLRIEVESTEPLPPAHGDSALLLRLRQGPAVAWQGALPPGEYLLSPPGRQGAPPPPLPRLVLPAGAGPGLLLSSAPRGLFLRMRPGRGPAPGAVRGPHAPHGPLQQGALLQPFDAQRFREELELHRAGLGPRPSPRVCLELGPPEGAPQGGGLLLELEQAFAQRLLDTLEIPRDPSGTPPDPSGTPPGQ